MYKFLSTMIYRFNFERDDKAFYAIFIIDQNRYSSQ